MRVDRAECRKGERLKKKRYDPSADRSPSTRSHGTGLGPTRGSDRVQTALWVLSAVLIVLVLGCRGRLGPWERLAQAALAACLLAMGVRMLQRLTAHGWWKGDWRSTLRHQRSEEWMALLVGMNVALIGLACMYIVVTRSVSFP